MGPGEGPKRQIYLNIIKFQFQSQFQRFLNQTLCVFSQMKDIKHIRRDFHSVTWIMPQWSDLGVPWGVGWSKFFFPKFNQIWCVGYLHQWHMQRHNFFSPHPLGRGQKVKHHKISITRSISKIFRPNFVCLLTNERYKTYQTRFSFLRLGHVPGVGLGGTVGMGESFQD